MNLIFMLVILAGGWRGFILFVVADVAWTLIRPPLAYLLELAWKGSHQDECALLCGYDYCTCGEDHEPLPPPPR